MDWFFFWLNGFHLAAQGVLQLFFAGRLTEKKVKMRHFIIYLLLLFTSNAAAVSMFNSDWLAMLLCFLALYGMNRLVLANRRPVSFVTAILAVYVTQLSSGAVNSLEMLLFPNALGHTLLLYLLVLLALLLNIALCLFCYRVIIEKLSLKENNQEPYIWILLPPGLYFLVMELYVLYSAYGSVLTVSFPMKIGKHLTLLVLQLLGLAALFSALYAYQRTCESFRAQAALNSLTQETDAQKKTIAQAQLRFEQTRAFRHDLKNHLSVLSGLLKSDDSRQALEYLQKLDMVTGELSFPIHTGNPVVDILLGDKLGLAKAEGAVVEVFLALPRPCAVNDFDLCVIFANALDNAIQAFMQVGGLKHMYITGVRQGDFLMLEFENTCISGPPLATGTGLSNVKAVAEKYGGAMTAEKTSSLFRLHVLLNIS